MTLLRLAIGIMAVLLVVPTNSARAHGTAPVLIKPLALVAAPAADAATAVGFDLPAGTQERRYLEAAADYMTAKYWTEAANALQKVLDPDEDKIIEIGEGKDQRTVSARAEAQRLIASLPPAGRKAYQEAQGSAAAELLREAVKQKDDEKLSAVVRRFLLTDSGPDALEALAGLQYDAGRYRLAALSYQRLLELRDAARWSPETLFRAADAFHRTGDKAHTDAAAKWMMDKIGNDGIQIGDRKLSRDEVQKELANSIEASGEWSMFGGDPGRSAQGDGGMPFLYRNWQSPTTVSSVPDPDQKDLGAKLTDLFKKASDQLTKLNQPVLPPQFPVTATVTMKKDGKKHSLVVFRTHAGIGASDLASGKLQGAAPINGSLDWWMSDNNHLLTFNQWTQAYIDQNQRPGVLFENTTIGSLSTDGDFAYTIEDLAIPPPPQFRTKGITGQPQNAWNWPADVFEMVNHSRLVAYELSSGCKIAWEAGGPGKPNEKSELTDSYFLGPPLPLDGRLFLLIEKQQELRLVGLETVPGDTPGSWKPRVAFAMSLGTVRDEPSGTAGLRRLHAAQLAYGDGVLVCPTQASCVVGVDLLTHNMVWAYRYETVKAAPAPAGIVLLVPTLPAPSWVNGAPIVSNGAVVVAPPDGVAISCLYLKTGELRWKESRQDDDLYLAGVFDGRVLVVGKKTCRALNLSDGKPLWNLDTGVPSGRGAAAAGVYYLPLAEAASSKEAEVCAIDMAKGQIIAHAPVRREHPGDKMQPVGNLLFYGGALISQTNDAVVAYPLLKTKLEEMEAKLTAKPDDAEGRVGRAELRLEQGDAAGAAEDLRKVLDSKPSPEVQSRIADLLKRAAPEQQKELEEIRRRLKDGKP